MQILRWLTVPMLLVALFVTACGGDGDGEAGADGSDTTEATPTAAEGGSTGDAGSGDASGDSGSSDSGGDGDAAAALAAIVGGMGEASFSATYALSGETSDGEPLSGKWTWVQDSPNDRSRFEATMEGQSVVMISTGDDTITCAEGSCFSMAALGGTMPNIGAMLTGEVENVEQEALAAQVEEVDGRTIAGVDTRCWSFTDNASTQTGVVCYSDGGVPLLIDSEAPEGTFTMEATAFAEGVSDADFEPPFPVTEIPGMGG